MKTVVRCCANKYHHWTQTALKGLSEGGGRGGGGAVYSGARLDKWRLHCCAFFRPAAEVDRAKCSPHPDPPVCLEVSSAASHPLRSGLR